jgi:hypothetical protein
MAESMIERVAQTISMRLYGGYPIKGETDRAIMAQWENTKALAREVIEAMREPTAAMSHVLGDAAKYGTRANGEVGPKDLMSDLIDAALKEHEGHV